MIVTIDGPAGAGKSSAARSLAERLGFRFLDTGAMYRAVTHAAIEQQIPLTDTSALEAVARGLDIELTDHRVLVNGKDVTDQIRTFEITTVTKHAADHPGVRDRLVELQRQAAESQDIVTEGRDQGTVAFPDAECKIFLTASERVRAERRHQDLTARGETLTLDEVLAKQHARDEGDVARKVGGLIKADDAVELSTDGMSPDEVVDRLHAIVLQKMSDN